jgi:hypothetical protein
MAERVGFEPTSPVFARLPAFEAGSFNRSDTSPRGFPIVNGTVDSLHVGFDMAGCGVAHIRQKLAQAGMPVLPNPAWRPEAQALLPVIAFSRCGACGYLQRVCARDVESFRSRASDMAR